MASKLPPVPAPHAELASYLAKNPDKSMVELIEPYRKFEAELRKLYAQELGHELLKDAHVNVLPLFTEHTSLLKVRARSLEAESQEEQEKYIMPLPETMRRANGSPATVQSVKEFRNNFNVFSESSLVDLDWDNVVASGSSVVNCLLPVPNKYNGSKRALREYYHEKFCPASDVDLFLYGLTEDQAVEKIKQIETSIQDSILTETTTVRTKHAITICSQYPTRHVQIVLRIYKSVSEILTGFDIDCSGAAYDGKQVHITPRALQSYMTQINHIDLSRRSPSYENRLSKYSHRSFEVYWPEVDRSRIDPTIFERSFQRTLGLARLLVLERLPTTRSREVYSAKRREERGRPPIDRNYGRTLRGNIKDRHEDEVADWVNEDEVSNYHTFTVPYGPKFHAKKIEKLCYTRDLLLNAEWNQSKKREVYLHRHPAFFGRFEDVIHDCCGYCPKPETEQEIEIAEEESKTFVSGEISFIKHDPGRQQIGSFNPLTEDDWTEMAYVGNTARLCQAIVDGDFEHVEDWLAQEGADPNTRDYTGRTPLHLAVTSSTPAIVKCLVEHGARLVARLADGRTALHLAAERGDVEIVKILMDKSAANEAEEEEKQDQRRKAKESSLEKETTEPGEAENEEEDEDEDGEIIDGEEDSDGEDRSMATGSFVKVKKDDHDDDVVPEDKEDEPDFYDVNVVAWDSPTSALHLAIVTGHDEVVRLLCQEYGADVLLPVKFQQPAALLTLVLALALPVEKAKSMAKTLLELGATCAQADLRGLTAFHRYVEENASDLLETLWDVDQRGAKTAINHIAFPEIAFPDNSRASSPLLAAIANGDVKLVLRLLDAGAAHQIDFEAWLKSAKQSSMESRLYTFESNTKLFNTSTEQPLLAALTSPHPDVAIELLNRGADPNVITRGSHVILQRSYWRGYDDGQSSLDVVRDQLGALREYDGETLNAEEPKDQLNGASEFLAKYSEGTWQHWVISSQIKETRKGMEAAEKHYEEEKARFEGLKGVSEKKTAIAELITVLEKIEKAILDKGGKTFDELHPDFKNKKSSSGTRSQQQKESTWSYDMVFKKVRDVTQARHGAYIELFEAAWRGDLDQIKKLTLAAWDDEKVEPPLKIAVTDNVGNSPFSLAFLRGYHDVAKAILEIAQAQYVPEDAPDARFKMATDEDACSDVSDSEGEEEPRIYREIIDDQFTIENIGEVSMQVKSRTKPAELLGWSYPSFVFRDGRVKKSDFGSQSLFRFVIHQKDHQGLNFLLDMGTRFTTQKLHPDEDPSRFFSFPARDFEYAVAKGRVEMLGEIIKRTGAGLPLDLLVKQSGVELKEKPRYYQGLTVYGKKRKDWAQAGRHVVSKWTGTKTSPLLHAAYSGCIESVEWFLSDAPLRSYLEFTDSKAAREDAKLKHLSQTPGGSERAIRSWLGNQNDLIIHAATIGCNGERTRKVIEYLVTAYPSSATARSWSGYTPLFLAYVLGKEDTARILIEAGADQATKDSEWENLLHAALRYNPEADQLRPLLELLDADVRTRLFRDRRSLSSTSNAGQTPLHKWLSDNVHGGYDYAKYKSTERMIEVLKLLLSYSGGLELEMLDGTGDTPLHTLIAKHADIRIIRAILDLRPQLLYRENAVGRTPLEVAQDKFIASKICAPYSMSHPDQSARTLVSRAPESFLPSSGADEEKEGHAGESAWDVVREYGERHPGKRRLVSLNEANDVAKRLGDKYQGQRYGIQQRDEKDEEDAAGKKAQMGLGTSDFVSDRYWHVKERAWKREKKDSKDEESGDE